MRVGVFGGTFDPVHYGHLAAAANACHAARLDTVLFVVANQPWQKASRQVSAAEDRYAMVQEAVADRDHFVASDIEIARGGDSYTVDTLSELSAGGDELFLIVGADVATELDTWERWEEVARMATLVVVSRPGAPKPNLGAEWRVVHAEMPLLDISSTDLRARAADGRPLDFLMPDRVIALVRQRALYDRSG